MKSHARCLAALILLNTAACDDTPSAEAPPATAAVDSEGAEHVADTDGEESDADTDGVPTDESSEGEEVLPDAITEARDALDGDLASQRSDLDAERLAIAQERAQMETARGELETRLQGVADLEERIDRRLGVGKVARERRLERLSALAALVSTMPPQAGAEMVSNMSDDDAQHLLLAVARTSDRRAAKLMALMPASRAAALGQLYLDTDPESVNPVLDADAAPPTSNPAAPDDSAAAPQPDGPSVAAQGPGVAGKEVAP